MAAAIAALFAPVFASAQVMPSITSPVEDSAFVTLRGNTHPLAKPQFDRGPVEDSKTGRMLLVLKRSPQQEQALREFIDGQHTEGSPNFHKWLTPEEFGKSFGAADADIATVSDYLQAHGFEVGRLSTGKMTIEVTGTAGQLRDTFHTQIHGYTLHGQQYFANASDPQIPAALAPVVAGFASLNNIRTVAASSHAAASLAAPFEPQTHRFKPQYTGVNTSGTYYLVAPADLQKIYDIPQYSAGTTYSGTGVSVGVVNDAQVNLNLVAQYQTLAGLPVIAPIEIVDGNDPIDATLSADAVNAYAQLELISAAAPGAQLYYYTSADTDYDTGLDFAIIRAVEDNAVSILAISAQNCEANIGATYNAFIGNAWLQAAAQGITVVAAAGDSGSAACDAPGGASSTGGLAVNGYASTPYNTAVGGTDFYYSPNGAASYWGTSAQNNNFYESAISYIPEQAWNDSILNVNDLNPSSLPSSVYGGGGGFSTVGSYSLYGTTGSPYPVQSWQSSFIAAWQKNSGITSVLGRGIPDVSFFAGNNYNSATYALCTQPADCVLNNGAVPFVTQSGGTAAAAGVFAGIMADVVQKMGARQGNVNPILYSLGSTAGIYHDTTKGSNSIDCTAGTGCNGTNLVAGTPAANAYNAAASWDPATGLGSIDAKNLIAAWKNLGTRTTTTALTITAYPFGPTVAKAVHGTGLTFTAIVSPNTGTVKPTGEVALNTSSPLPSYGTLNGIPLTNGQGASLTNYFLPGGTYNVSAYYPGDTSYEASTSPGVPVTITPEPSQLEFISSNIASGGTIAYGSPFSITIEPYSLTKNNVSTPTGNISVFNGGSYPIQVLPLNSEGAATYYNSVLAQGTYGFTFKFSGDPSYAPSEINTPYPITVVKGVSTTTLSANATTVTATGKGNGSVTVTAIVSNAGSGHTGAAPTGQVQFLTNPTQTANLTAGFDANNQAVGIATVTVLSGRQPASGSLTGKYLGDTNYATSTSNALPLTASTTNYTYTSTITVTANPTTVSANGALALTATVKTNGAAGAGTVNFYANAILLNPTPFAVTGGTGTYTVPLVNDYLPIVSGTAKLTAVFTPSTGTASPSTATAISVTITDNRTNSDFSLSTDAATQTLSPTASNTYFQAQVTSIANFSTTASQVNLTCTVPGSSNLTCTFPDTTNTNKSTISVITGATGVVLTPVEVSGFPTVVTASVHPQPQQEKWWLVGGGSTLACLLLFGIPARRKVWQGILTILVCVAFVTSAIAGCGGASLSQSLTNSATSTLPGSNSSPAATANATGGGVAANLVASGTYQVVITGTATTSNTTLTHNTPVNIVVSSTPTIPSGSTYSLTSLNSQLLVTNPVPTDTANTALVQDPAGIGSQRWIFTYQSGGYYTITSAAFPDLYMTEASAPGSGTNATLQKATGDASQLWALDSVGSDTYEIVNGNTVSNGSTPGVLDDNAFGATNGTTVLVYPQKDITQSVNQTWYIQPN